MVAGFETAQCDPCPAPGADYRTHRILHKKGRNPTELADCFHPVERATAKPLSISRSAPDQLRPFQRFQHDRADPEGVCPGCRPQVPPSFICHLDWEIPDLKLKLIELDELPIVVEQTPGASGVFAVYFHRDLTSSRSTHPDSIPAGLLNPDIATGSAIREWGQSLIHRVWNPV